jgi:hypothetical protein
MDQSEPPRHDTGERGANGVVASVVLMPDGSVRLILDDVAAAAASEQRIWHHKVLFTFNDYPRDRFAECKLSERSDAHTSLHAGRW